MTGNRAGLAAGDIGDSVGDGVGDGARSGGLDDPRSAAPTYRVLMWRWLLAALGALAGLGSTAVLWGLLEMSSAVCSYGTGLICRGSGWEIAAHTLNMVGGAAFVLGCLVLLARAGACRRWAASLWSLVAGYVVVVILVCLSFMGF